MFSTESSKSSAAMKTQVPPPPLIAAYMFFLAGAAWLYHLVADGDGISAIFTIAEMLQCLAMLLLAGQVLSTGKADGISARAVGIEALALCCRLSSTLWLNGYLPVDASGDYVFQAIDIFSLVILIGLMYQIYVTKQHTYQADEDSLPIMPMVIGAFCLAALLHGNMNGRPVFDTLWMAGLFVSTIAVLPQLWLITRAGGCADALTSHHIVAMAASRVLSGLFMWHARDDISCAPWVSGVNHASWAILAAHFLHMLLLGDFAYYYVKAVIAQGLNCRIELTESCGV